MQPAREAWNLRRRAQRPPSAAHLELQPTTPESSGSPHPPLSILTCHTCSQSRTPSCPPARADAIPAGASSMTRHSAASNPNPSAPFKYGSGCGFPFTTSSDVTRTLGTGTPQCGKRCSASSLDPDVTTPHRSVRNGFHQIQSAGHNRDSSLIVRLMILDRRRFRLQHPDAAPLAGSPQSSAPHARSPSLRRHRRPCAQPTPATRGRRPAWNRKALHPNQKELQRKKN